MSDTWTAAGLPPLQVVPVNRPLLTPVDLFQVKDFGPYLMVRAANMKITVAKNTGTIVNISGGGCPDVPFLAQEMVGKTLEGARPGDIGHTLCGYALQLAYEEMLRRCPGCGHHATGGFSPREGRGQFEMPGLDHQRMSPQPRHPRAPGRGRQVANPEPTLSLALSAGDTGRGQGSLQLYQCLCPSSWDTPKCTSSFTTSCPMWTGTTASCLPFRDGPATLLIADAGFMYAAKMSGQAPEYDLFTPDVGELAFLADETAPHPFYTRGFILHEDNQVPDLVARAYAHDNAARLLLVKGTRDYLAGPEGIVARVDHPNMRPWKPSAAPATPSPASWRRWRRRAMNSPPPPSWRPAPTAWPGHLAQPTPATQVLEIIRRIPAALEIVLGQWQNRGEIMAENGYIYLKENLKE